MHDLRGIGLTVEQLVTMDPDGRHDNFTNYLEGMKRSDYAGEVEINLLAENLKKPIFVYKTERNIYRKIATYGNFCFMTFLSFIMV